MMNVGCYSSTTSRKVLDRDVYGQLYPIQKFFAQSLFIHARQSTQEQLLGATLPASFTGLLTTRLKRT